MNATSLPSTIYPAILSLLMLLVVPPVGCSRTRDPDKPQRNPPEPSIAEQAHAVRERRSNQIRLDRTLVVDRDLKSLSGLESELLRINFSHTEITDAGLARLSQMKEIEQLRLASPRITDAGLACLRELPHLRFLHLIDIPITDSGLEHLHSLKSLESLYLDGTRITDDGIQRLIAALPQVHLHVDDHHHRLDPHGAEHTH
ncbi:MAG: hypothetical protein HY288_10670 [Planctomycetia bacterium]|nr:hypothetical protein [Planctomycetia bacterium]